MKGSWFLAPLTIYSDELSCASGKGEAGGTTTPQLSETSTKTSVARFSTCLGIKG